MGLPLQQPVPGLGQVHRNEERFLPGPALGSAAQGLHSGWPQCSQIFCHADLSPPLSPVAGGWEEHREQPASSRLLQGLSCSFRLLGTEQAPPAQVPGASWLHVCLPNSGADDLLPILSFVALKSGLPQLVSECAALEEFIHERWGL